MEKPKIVQAQTITFQTQYQKSEKEWKEEIKCDKLCHYLYN